MAAPPRHNSVCDAQPEEVMGMTEDKKHPEHHINMIGGDIAPAVLIAEARAYVPLFAQLVDKAHKGAEKREYLTYTG
jgi:hypothetical protein